jgi:hypothetical protein
LIGCFQLNLDNVISFCALTVFFLPVDCWLTIRKYYFYRQHLYDGCCKFPFLLFHLQQFLADGINTMFPNLCKTGKCLSLVDVLHSPNVIECTTYFLGIFWISLS